MRIWSATQRTDSACSKTFLARLCEQAERYDGRLLQRWLSCTLLWLSADSVPFAEMVNYMKVCT